MDFYDSSSSSIEKFIKLPNIWIYITLVAYITWFQMYL